MVVPIIAVPLLLSDAENIHFFAGLEKLYCPGSDIFCGAAYV